MAAPRAALGQAEWSRGLIDRGTPPRRHLRCRTASSSLAASVSQPSQLPDEVSSSCQSVTHRHAVHLPDTPYETSLNAWAKQQSDPDFCARLASNCNLPVDGGKINELDSMYARSTGQRSSVAVHARSEIDSISIASTTATEAIPPLTRGNSIRSSTDSADTDLASALDGVRLLESRDGVLALPDTHVPNADLICPFQILDCEDTFSDMIIFKTHVFSHFRGHPCPEIAACFLCDARFAQSKQDHAARAWNEMLSHLANDHYRHGERLAVVRTDFHLMRYMFARRIVSDAQFKRTQMCPVPVVMPASASALGREEIVNVPRAPTVPPPRPNATVLAVGAVGHQNEPFTVQAGSRRERRNRTARRLPS